MAEKKKLAPEEGPNGVDRWTSNGYGITLGGKEVVPIEPEEAAEEAEIDEIEEVD